MATPAPLPTAAAPPPQVPFMTRLLNALNQGVGGSANDPSHTALMGLAAGLGQAGAPHMLTPISAGQALSMGLQGAKAMQAKSQAITAQRLANLITRQAALPFQKAKTAEAVGAITGQSNPKLSPQTRAADQGLALNLLSPGYGTAVYQNSPAVVGAKTLAQTMNELQKLPANERAMILSRALGIPAQGALPEGSSGTPSGGVTQMPGAAPVIASNAFNKAGAGAAAAAPYQQLLRQTGFFRRPLTDTAAFRIPPVPPFMVNGVPLSAGGPQSGPQQLGMAPSLDGGMPSPAVPPRPPVPMPLPAAPGAPPAAGLTGPALTPSQVTGQKTAQKLATDQLSADISMGTEAQQRVANLEELNAVASQLKTGPGVESRIAVEKALAAIPGFAGEAQKLATITNAQIFNKTALNLSLQTVSGAGQHAYDAFKSVMNAFPELSKTNLANSVVTASLLATARYQRDRGLFAGAWQKANNGMGFVQGKGSANGVWGQNAPFMAYFLNALPPEAVNLIMQKARTNATLRHEVMQARSGYQWITQNVPSVGGAQ